MKQHTKKIVLLILLGVVAVAATVYIVMQTGAPQEQAQTLDAPYPETTLGVGGKERP